MMNKNLDEYIKTLSKKDSKNLSQKGLKTVEEVGELARVLLPFDNAFATNHRFVDREKILEEIADVYLTTISIAYDLDFTNEEIESMITKKADKWAGLINQEKDVKWPMPFEIHVTVKDIKKDVFQSVCEHLEVKPIVLDIQNNDGKTVFEDVMTSSRHYGTNRSAYEEMKRISNTISSFTKGKVVREKIETAIWHPAAPTNVLQDMPPNCYFECHIGVVCNNTETVLVQDIAKIYDAHLSRNIYKKLDGGSFILMMTYRTYGGSKKDFEDHVKTILKSLDENNIQYKNVTKEFSIYDTKVSHDSTWITT